MVNQILGNLLHLHWLGFVTHPVSAEQVPCLSWDMYCYQFDGRYHHAQRAIWNAFWVSFSYFNVDDFQLKFGFAEQS
jgi:hypothetical protein